MSESTMQVIEITQPGGPEVLKHATRPVPEPEPGQVLIRVHTAGVNRPDCFQRAGLYPPPPGASDLPGLEVAGEIAALGSDVRQWQKGDRVCALTAGGGYAEYVAVDARHCLAVPENIDLTLAAALPEAAFTVYSNVWMRGQLRPGETLLVHGGSSGIGSTAIQIAKALGSRVIATAGTEEKCRFSEALGADHCINYRQGDWADTLASLAPDGVDVVLDMVAGDYTARNIAALAIEGRYVVIALLGGATADGINMGHILRKRLVVTGSTLRPQSDDQKAVIATALSDHIMPLLASGGLVPMIFEQFPLAQAADAHALMESGQHMGKIVLGVSLGESA